ncbi:MFS transporter [Clostridium sp. HBUAS56017]|uniref:MFS transporter n=1 Tax=Clostridium sp. HBUAS56017 TaxID=2571128 RepID=UPI0011780988|nr:MFS transporter [Clostridium sp. HBUAS56017]
MKDSYSFKFKLFYLIYYGAIGSFMPYINVYLEKSAKLSGSQIGVITALSLIFGFCVTPIWGIIGDKTKGYNALLKNSLGGALVMVVLYYNASTYLGIILCAIGLEMLRLGTTPMSDTLATSYCHKIGGNYGSIRAMGSLGYMLSSMVVGFLADKIGLDGPLFISYAWLLIIALPITFSFPKNSREDKDKEDKVKQGNLKELITNKNYRFILGITILTTVIVDSSTNYAGNHLVSTLGGSESLISWMTFITVLPEVVFLMIAIKIIKKIGFKKYYVLVVFSMILRFGIYSVTSNSYAFLAASIFHCLGVSISTVGSLTYIRNSVNTAMLGTAITLFNASTSIGKAFFGYIFGVVYEYGNSYMIFMICATAFIVALLILLRTKRFDNIYVSKHKVG